MGPEYSGSKAKHLGQAGAYTAGLIGVCEEG
jgi:hypothetical protein